MVGASEREERAREEKNDLFPASRATDRSQPTTTQPTALMVAHDR